ncbi:MAG: hypothetical protein HY459_00080 [Parcubacteria group bacterium]|nr:hypothetical protein [Parcubacteria group bacterium]
MLEDLYAVDPTLREHEAALTRVTQYLLASRPDAKVDPAFMARLRQKLMEGQVSQAASSRARSIPFLSFNLISMKQLPQIVGGLAVLTLLVVGSAYLVTQNQDTFSARSRADIRSVGERAFGPLALSVNPRPESGGGGASAPAGKGGGGLETGESLASPSVVDSEIYIPTIYRYAYKGEPLSLPSTEAKVLKRIKGNTLGSQLTGFLNRSGLGLLNFGSFSNPSVQSFQINEERDFGYSIFVDLNEGAISINENWQRWPHPEAECQDEACFERYRVKEGDIPADEVLINLANRFLADHGIPTEFYGEPVVNNTWREEYLRASDKASFYIPDFATVIYPLKIDGQEVYDEGGFPSGISVNINVRSQRVSGLWGLTTQNYQSSLYGAETDVDRILEIASRGGFRMYPYEDPSAKIVEVELGTPKEALVRVWTYEANLGNELLVPALIFPVTKAPEGEAFYTKDVVVPLVKEVLDEGNGGGPIKILPVPLPLEKIAE